MKTIFWKGLYSVTKYFVLKISLQQSFKPSRGLLLFPQIIFFNTTMVISFSIFEKVRIDKWETKRWLYHSKGSTKDFALYIDVRNLFTIFHNYCIIQYNKKTWKENIHCLLGKIMWGILVTNFLWLKRWKIYSLNFYHDSSNWWDHSRCYSRLWSWSVDPYFEVITQEMLHKKVKWSIFIGGDIEVFLSGWVRGEGAIGGG